VVKVGLRILLCYSLVYEDNEEGRDENAKDHTRPQQSRLKWVLDAACSEWVPGQFQKINHASSRSPTPRC
jgi:hypothetical protein